jgi:hypothetical protein
MHADRNGGILLPGILNQAAIINLKKLSSGTVVMDASQVLQLQRPEYSRNYGARTGWVFRNLSPAPILTLQYPTLWNLKELAMSLEGCKSFLWFDLIDAVPALQYLED